MTVFPVHPYCKFKTPLVGTRAPLLCDTAREVLHYMAAYCEERKVAFVLTETVTAEDEDRKLKRVSDTHLTGRAFDISVRNWKEPFIEEFVQYFEKRFISVAALGKSNNPRLILRHNNGNGDHIHVQVARLFGVKNPLKVPRA